MLYMGIAFFLHPTIANSQSADTSRIERILKNVNTDLPGLNLDSFAHKISWPVFSLPKMSLKDPVRITGGNISYYFDYRSNIDTPFAEQNIAQHNVMGQVGIIAFNALPLNVSFFIRRTNSSLFANLNDVRIDFNANEYARSIWDSYRRKINTGFPNIKDSLLQLLKQFKSSQLATLINQIHQPAFRQRVIECTEILNVPAIAESVAGVSNADSVRKVAKAFIENYQLIRSKETQYRAQVDSIEQLIGRAVSKAAALRTMGQGNSIPHSPSEMLQLLQQQGVHVPKALKHLLSLRKFSVGRSQLNHSELTARNISLNGINIEYNSWYYFALAAGTVDYRYRDFVVNRSGRKPQYLYTVRIGVGRLEKNYIIFSAFKGQKQSYQQQNSSSGSRTLEVYGISTQVKYRLNRNNYVIAEVAESAGKGLGVYGSSKPAALFRWKDKTNKAYSVKLYSNLPLTKTKLEAMYRYSGAAFQSFDRFQVNSSQESWYVKAEQYFWKKQIRLLASLRSNEFTNPYIIQQYSSDIIFKSVQLTFRRKRWPVISAGYMPSSQVTKIDGVLTENRYQSLNMVAYHQYKVGLQKQATTVTYNRFYNNATDTGFIYFNAVNFYFQHHLFFNRFTASIGASHSKNTGFELNVLEESLQFSLWKNANIGMGVRINNYNRLETKVGSWIRASCRFMKSGWLQFYIDNGFIPSNNGHLARNQLVSLGINKTF